MVLVMMTVVVSPRWIVCAVVVTVRVTLQLQRMQAAAMSDSTAITRYLRIAQPPLLVADLIASHELGQKESTQGVVLLLGVEANLSGSALGSVSHLSLRVVRRVAEQVTLRQHTSSDGGAGIAELADVRLLGEGVDTKIHIGVRARLAVNGSNWILKFNFLILTRHKIKFYVSKVKGQRQTLYIPLKGGL